MRLETARRIALIVLTFCLVLATARPSHSDSGKAFASPPDATTALVSAAKAGDRAELEAIFGPESHDLFFSGDDVADLRALARFAEWADQATAFVEYDDGSVEVVVGDEGWPLPMPLVRGAEGWRFDTAAGKEELINRRIGANELSAIDVCRALVEAQLLYASLDRDGDGVKEYAQKILSDEGKKNGLYWNTEKHGGQPSPIGPLAATAAEEGYRRAADRKPTPFHGYFFRVLDGQGPHAPGGKKSYVGSDGMTAGFAFLAYPADYGVSGIMTFLINRNGIMFQKDLGENTEKIAAAIRAYDPDETWSVVKD